MVIEGKIYVMSLFEVKDITGLSVPCNDSPIASSSGTTLNCVK